MTVMTRRMIGAAVFGAVFAASLAAAEAQQMAQTPPVRIRGTIEKVDGSTLTIKARDGQTMQVELADNPTIRTVVKKTVADIKQGLFVGITAMPQPDGTQKAVEIHIFPEAARGTGEGHRPWDLMPNSTMTNANVDSEVAISDGKKLVLKYKDGEKTFIVPERHGGHVHVGRRERPQAGSKNLHRRRDQESRRHALGAGRHGGQRRRRPANVIGYSGA